MQLRNYRSIFVARCSARRRVFAAILISPHDQPPSAALCAIGSRGVAAYGPLPSARPRVRGMGGSVSGTCGYGSDWARIAGIPHRKGCSAKPISSNLGSGRGFRRLDRVRGKWGHGIPSGRLARSSPTTPARNLRERANRKRGKRRGEVTDTV